MIFTLPSCLISLDSIAEQHDINILYACESGSRAWGIESPDSDYDIRFIYHRPVEQYLRLTPRKDTIQHLEGDLDLVGWDLLKVCQLAVKSNPSILEWLHSPIVYYEDENFVDSIRNLMCDFSPRALMYHYTNLASGQFKQYWKEDEDVILKKYLYAIRPLFAVLWMEKHPFDIPPLKFTTLFLEVEVEPEIKKAVLDLLALKARGMEKAKGRWALLDQFITDYIPICRDKARYASIQEPNRELLQVLFQEFVLSSQ